MTKFNTETAMIQSNAVLTLATCWKLKTKNGDILGFTDLDTDLSIDGIKYNARTGFNRSAVESSVGTSVDNLEVEAIIDSDLLSEDDILSGKYDFAEITIFVIDYTNPASEKLMLRTGWIGEISLSSGKFIAEIKGLMNSLNGTLGDLYSPSCRANLGDKKCNIDLTKYEYIGKISTVVSEDAFIDLSINRHDNYYAGGKVYFIDGPNADKPFQIASQNGNRINLMTTPHFKLEAETKYKMYVGCDKSFDTCINTFNNAINFRGEPHINKKV
ncbi:MAG: DUF2163 domain-containing protein [Alphaproteobacteria bacterium]|jgi:uncharacterized phage protein (TIGR02218 family)|nr:DUF2163 domain-containing protein [Candidatus Jidaibacter sp.]